MKHQLVIWLGGFALCVAAPLAQAVSLADIREAVREGEARFDIRYRYEYVDQVGFDKNAHASTVRPRFTWASKPVDRWRFGIETDYVAAVFIEPRNEGLGPSARWNTRHPAVADPEGFDLNQAFVRYDRGGLTTTLGRQRILIADQRFIGGVGWRQNEQTYDALRMQLAIDEYTSLDYGRIWNVNRIFGPRGSFFQPSDWRGNTHYIRGEWIFGEGQVLSGFGYLFDFLNGNGINNSNRTFGVAYQGSWGPVRVAGTLASQSDYGESILEYSADYASIAADVTLETITLRIGYDVLGSDEGRASFRTPSATLHKFQGWADKFLTTPRTGVEDLHVGAEATFGSVTAAITYHVFGANHGGRDHGTEINFVATMPVGKFMSAQFKFAQYQADHFATDTTKAWLTITAGF